MAKCIMCGCEFDLGDARRRIGRQYGAGFYNECYPDGDVCGSCADIEIGSDMSEGAEIMELMGTGWDDDD